MAKWKSIGVVRIDTGHMLLADPALAADVACDHDREQLHDSDGRATAVVVEAGYGDGYYLVEGQYVEVRQGDLRLSELRIRFIDKKDRRQLCYRPRPRT
jgi:hypothetical protein